MPPTKFDPRLQEPAERFLISRAKLYIYKPNQCLLENMSGRRSERKPLLTNRMSTVQKMGICKTVVGLVVAVATFVALGFAIAAYVRVDKGKFNNLKITGQLDLTGASILDPDFVIPAAATASRGLHGRTASQYNLPPNNQKVKLQVTNFEVHIPANLRRYRNKLYTVYSGSDDAHALTFDAAVNFQGDTDPHDHFEDDRGKKCERSTAVPVFWDKHGRFPTALFDPKEGCYIIFEVVDCYTVIVHEARGIRYCTQDLTECEGTSSQVVEDLTVTGDLIIQDMTDRIIPVGPTRTFKTVTEALAQFNGRHAGRTTIKLDKGKYVDEIDIGSKFSASARINLDGIDQTTGLRIVGDERKIAGHTFVNGLKNINIDSSIGVSISFNNPAFTTVPIDRTQDARYNPVLTFPYSLSGELVFGGVACANNAGWTGKIVIAERGVCGFSAKTFSAQNSSALALIVYNTGGSAISLGGTPSFTVTMPTFSIGESDGRNIVESLAAATSPVTVTIAGTYPRTPVFGTDKGTVLFESTANPLQLKVTITDAPAGSSLFQPNFQVENLEAGDKIYFVHDLYSTTDDPDFWNFHNATVVSVLNNVITFTAPVATEVFLPGTAMVISPNVAIQSTPLGRVSPLRVSHSAVQVEGIRFEGSDTTKSLQIPSIIAVYDGNIELKNVFSFGNRGSNVALDLSNSKASLNGHVSCMYAGIRAISSTIAGETVNVFGVTSRSSVDLLKVEAVFRQLRVLYGQDILSTNLFGLYLTGSDLLFFNELALSKHMSYTAWIEGDSKLRGLAGSTLDMRRNGYCIETFPYGGVGWGQFVVKERSSVALDTIYVRNHGGSNVFGIFEQSKLDIFGTSDFELSTVSLGFPNTFALSEAQAAINYGNIGPHNLYNIREYSEDSDFDLTVNTHKLTTSTLTLALYVYDGPYIGTQFLGGFDFRYGWIGTKHTIINDNGAQHIVYCQDCVFKGDGVSNPGVDNVLTFSSATCVQYSGASTFSGVESFLGTEKSVGSQTFEGAQSLNGTQSFNGTTDDVQQSGNARQEGNAESMGSLNATGTTSMTGTISFTPTCATTTSQIILTFLDSNVIHVNGIGYSTSTSARKRTEQTNHRPMVNPPDRMPGHMQIDSTLPIGRPNIIEV